MTANHRSFITAAMLTALITACGGGAPTQSAPAPETQLTLSLSTTKLPVTVGTTESMNVTLNRAGVTGPVTLSVQGLPAGTTAPSVTVPAGSNVATLQFTASGAAAHSLPTNVKIRAVAAGSAAETSATVTVRGAPGAFDTTFAGGHVMTDVDETDNYGEDVAVQPDGKVVVVASSPSNIMSGTGMIMRYTRDGKLDESFGGDGIVKFTTPGEGQTARAVAIQPDGKIVVVSAAFENGQGKVILRRFTGDGTPDSAFDHDGVAVGTFPAEGMTVSALLVQPDGKLLVGGSIRQAFPEASVMVEAPDTAVDFMLARFKPNGAVDETFGAGGYVAEPITEGPEDDYVTSLALQEVAGEQRIVAVGGSGEFKLARFRPTGELDVTFGTDGKVSSVFGDGSTVAYDVAVQPDGKIVAVGSMGSGGSSEMLIARFDVFGQLDKAFGTNGLVNVNVGSWWEEFFTVAVQPDGKIVAGGYVAGDTGEDVLVMRFNSTGAVDTTFGDGGVVLAALVPGAMRDEVRSIALQPDSRIPATRVIALGSAHTPSDMDVALVRLWP